MSKENKRGIFQRWFIDAMSGMALGLFSSLIIGLIISQMSKITGLGFLKSVTGVLGANSPVIGSAIGAGVAYALKADPMVCFSCAGASAVGYAAGGPVGAYISGIVGAELGQLVSKRTPADILVTPFVTIVCGGLAGNFVGPYVQTVMNWLGDLINEITTLYPLIMGLLDGIIVGMCLTLPISSAALCIMLGLDGLAAGAACAGCCAQMVGFAVISFRENGLSGLLSQGLGTSMLQMSNILRHPQIWIAPTVAGGVAGAVSAGIFGMICTPAGAGMGTSGLVGQITTYAAMEPTWGAVPTLLLILFVHIVLPALVALAVDCAMRRVGWVKGSYMTLHTF